MSGDRGPQLRTIARLALAGGWADALRIALTVLGSLFATAVLLLGAAVTGVGPDDGPYFTTLISEPGLHPGVIFAMVMLSLVSLSFVGQCSRIGAPARDRRLAAIRMAGATPRDARMVLAAEVFCAALLGAILAGALYLVMHQWFPIRIARHYIEFGEKTVTRGLVLPTDVLPNPLVFLLILLVVPIGATMIGLVALRRTALTPFGVVRRVTHRPPALAPLILFLVGAGGLIGWSAIPGVELSDRGAFLILLPVLVLCTSVGVIFGSAATAYRLGQLGASRTGSPAVLIACRRMIDAPFTASRSSAALVLAVLIGAGAQGLRANFLLETSYPGQGPDQFFVTAFDLIDLVLVIVVAIAVGGLLVVAVEGMVSRRRTLAALVASGVPRRTLAVATMLEVAGPLVPTVLITTVTGLLAVRGIYGTTAFPGGNAAPVAVPIPWADLTTLTGGTLLVAIAITALSLLFLRRATDLTELRTAA